jgi:hypothetical protein
MRDPLTYIFATARQIKDFKGLKSETFGAVARKGLK